MKYADVGTGGDLFTLSRGALYEKFGFVPIPVVQLTT